jgi:Fe(3+) dicitrate transport protein
MTELLSWLGPLGDPTHRIFAPFLLGSLLVAAIWAGGEARSLFDRRLWLHRSSVLDVQLMLVKMLARTAGLMPALLSAFALAFGVVSLLDRTLGAPSWSAPSWAVTGAYTLVLFVAWDASKYILHRLAHEVPALWSLHQVHHSAEVMTPLTFYRTHPLESMLFELRGALVTGVVTGLFYWAFRGTAEPVSLLGVNVLGFGFNLLGGNLRHSHVWLRYPVWAERWFVSPAMHQLHHTPDCERNYGTWLAVWDRWAGSWDAATERPETFGLRAEDCNHAPDDLLGALIGPLKGWFGGRPAALAALLLVVPAVAWAEDVEHEEAEDEDAEEEEDEEDDSASMTVTIVDTRKGLPRVAGSAHTVDEEELERLENDDIHRVLAPVPGVYVRGEDGYGLRPNIGLRGANSDRSAKITLMEDGVLLGPAPYAAPAAYYFPTMTRMVGVEVFKGPAATRHGPQTIGGAINMQTRPIPATLDGGLDLAFGKDMTRKAHGWVGTSGSFWGFLVEGVHLATDGFKALPDDGRTGFDKNEFMLKARIHSPQELTRRTSLELKVGYANERSWETYLGLSDADFAADPYQRYVSSSEGFMSWHRTQTELAWQTHFGPKVDLRVVGYHHWMDRSWRKLNGFRSGPRLGSILANPEAGRAAVYSAVLRGDIDSPDSDHALMVGTNARSFHSAGVQSLLHWRAGFKKLSSELEIGLRIHGDQIARNHTEDPYLMAGGRMIAEGRETEQVAENTGKAFAIAAHVHEELGIGPLRILPGVRLEVVRTEFEDAITGAKTDATRAVVLPGLGVHVQPTPWLSVLGGVHRGFSPVAPGQAKETLPETSWAYEFGGRVGFRGFRAEVIGFFNDYENLSGQCTFSAGCDGSTLDRQYNAGRVYVYGAEVLVGQTVYLPHGMELKGGLSYTYTGSHFATSFVSGHPQFGSVSEGDKLPYVPEHQGLVSLAFAYPYGSVDVVVKGQSHMRDVAGQGEAGEDETIAGHVVLDIGAAVKVWGPLSLYTTLNNVTNAQYMVGRRPFGARPGRPFHVMFGVKLRGFPEWPGLAKAS